MSTRLSNDFLKNLHRLVACSDCEETTDGRLLDRFLSSRDGDAFAAIVRRHGPMVWGVCRRMLRNEADAEDAFQATFLVLVRSAKSIRRRETLGNWLYGVAYRVALKARAMISKRKTKEQQHNVMPEHPAPADPIAPECQDVFDEELQRLPEKNRTAIVLCELQGLSRKAAARQLRIPEGTLSSRLARGRKLLARQLLRRGIKLSTGIIVSVTAKSALATGFSGRLLSSTIDAAIDMSTGQAATIPIRVAALTEGVMKTMFFDKIAKKTVVGLLVLFFVAGSGTLLLSSLQAQSSRAPKNSPSTPPAEAKQTILKPNLENVETAFFHNEAFAEEKYTGKRIHLTTYWYRIKKVSRNGSAYYWMVLDPTLFAGGLVREDEDSSVTTIFEFDLESRKQLAQLDPKVWMASNLQESIVPMVEVEGTCAGTILVDGRRYILFRNSKLLKICTEVDSDSSN